MDHQDTRSGLPYDSWPESEVDDQRTIAQVNSSRKAFRTTARAGFIIAPAMFLLPLVYPLLGLGWHFLPIICMTAAWAVLVSACSFAAMTATEPAGHPWVHQVWAVPAAVLAMFPGGIAAFVLYGSVVATVHQATK